MGEKHDERQQQADSPLGGRESAGAAPGTGGGSEPEVVALLAALFEGAGSAEYFGEDVTQAEHMLQAGALAQEAGASPSLVAAALLHDVGHFEGEVGGAELMQGTDNRHSHSGADWLSRWFGPEVTEPVRLHVDAKRYLCAVEPDYFAKLSEASVYTLSVQGGPMSQQEAAAFAARPFADDAVRLRRWDEQAKDSAIRVPGFDAYRGILTRLAAARPADDS
jgi:phosphonate degradation associated HDIG domain protein